MLPCCFCDKTFEDMGKLALHLCDSHPSEFVLIGRNLRTFRYRRRRGGKRDRVNCFCNESFTLSQLTPLCISHGLQYSEKNSFLAHLRREGGIQEHLDKLREEALLDRLR